MRAGPIRSRLWYGAGLLALIAIVCTCGLAEGNGARRASQNTTGTSVSASQNSGKTPAAASTEERASAGRYVLSPERARRARQYSRTLYSLYFVRVLMDFALLLLILRLGIAVWLRNFAESLSGSRWLQAAIFMPAILVIVELGQLPVSIYGHSLSLRYEQSIQRWGSWLADYAKASLLSILLAVVVVWILDALMRRSPRRWWLCLWMALLPISAALVFGAPLVIDPIFNQFQPLEQSHPALVKGIEEIAQHAGIDIPANRMFLMKASEKTNEMNAYVTGLGASKRVVVWDNTIQKLGRNETLFIVGHELGHYVLGHVWKGYLFFAGMLLACLYFAFRGLHWALGHWSAAWGIYSDKDWAAFVLLLLIVQVLLFFCTPAANSFSRFEEHQADVYGLEVIHGVLPDSRQIAAQAFQKLGESDLADPDPPGFLKYWLYSHPPLAERLAFAYDYDPWRRGESPRYVKQAVLAAPVR